MAYRKGKKERGPCGCSRKKSREEKNVFWTGKRVKKEGRKACLKRKGRAEKILNPR